MTAKDIPWPTWKQRNHYEGMSGWRVDTSTIEYTLRFYHRESRMLAWFTWQYMPYAHERPDMDMRTRKVYERHRLPSVAYRINGPDMEFAAKGVLDMAYAGVFGGSQMHTVRSALEVEVKRGLIGKLLDLERRINVYDPGNEDATDVVADD